MRFLRVLCLALVLARRFRHVGVTVILANDFARLRDGRIVDLHAVGSHIGDETGGLAADIDAFIEPLRDPHGVRRRKTEFAAGFLLQCRGGERRLRIAPRRPCLDAGNREAGRLDRFLEIFGFRARANVEALNLLAVGADQPRLECFGARGRHGRDQRPVFARDEFFDLQFAVADQPQCHRLHSAGGTCAGQFAPQHRR